MPETTPLIKAALNLRVGAEFDVYVLWADWMYSATAEHEHEAKRNANGLCE
ncbi:Uncharacterised protein [uncultured Clostridium sp.]|nr:Uncharacterised protein [uncultured Clostridium sp.]